MCFSEDTASGSGGDDSGPGLVLYGALAFTALVLVVICGVACYCVKHSQDDEWHSDDDGSQGGRSVASVGSVGSAASVSSAASVGSMGSVASVPSATTRKNTLRNSGRKTPKSILRREKRKKEKREKALQFGGRGTSGRKKQGYRKSSGVTRKRGGPAPGRPAPSSRRR